MSKQRVLTNLLVLGTGQIATWAISTLFLIVVSRYLGPARQGELSLAVSAVAVFGLVVMLGMDTLIVRTVARTPERIGTIISTALVVRVALSIPVIGALYVYAHLAHLNVETRQAVYILALGMVGTACSNAALSAFRGREQMSRVTVAALVDNVVELGLALVVIALHGSVIAFAAIATAITFIVLALTMRWISRVAPLTWRVSRREMQDVVVGSLAFWANDVFLTIYLYIDSIVLFSVAGSPAVGVYTPAMRLFSVALFLPSIIGTATLPQLSRLGVGGGDRFVDAGRKVLSLMIASAIPLTIGLATFAEPLIVTVFGPAYHLSASVLAILSLCIPCTFLNIQLSQLLTARDQQRQWTAIMAASCILNPLINLFLISVAEHRWHNGAVGAALALLATEIIMTVYGIVVLRDVACDWSIVRVAFGACVAGAIQFAVVRLTAAWWPPLGEVLGVAAYGALVVPCGVLSKEDVGLLYESIAGRIIRRTRRVNVPAPEMTS